MAKIASNSLIFIQTPNSGSAYNLSTYNIGMQNPMSENRTLRVTIGYSQNLHNSIRGVPKRVS
ncbi:hypothetical protein XBFM1_1730011 [Xenorhabdus bovienii str. feltiae Moldova]|uniref:Uncharacterized protein n=1 Tax=Xenorhabdus bovienii str. feltiae Moldova TaxID=1398200 RepID=A0A077NQD0_XENBV|nr:hypothetical protein XBFM1_1730011 [Xenorhabdus bovienii str. feltiae Moldova]